jgi:hypothetical protein
MTRRFLVPAAGLACAFLPVQPATAQPAPTAKPAALCVPPGASEFAPCAPARAGQTIRLQVATTDLPTSAINLLFTEQAAAGQPARTATETIPASVSRDGSYEVTVPRELCASRPGSTGSFEVQHVFTAFSEGAVTPKSLGWLTVAC